MRLLLVSFACCAQLCYAIEPQLPPAPRQLVVAQAAKGSRSTATAQNSVDDESFDFPAFPSASQTPVASRKPQRLTRIPNPQTEPRAYYDYCTSAAAYWRTRADKAVLPAELNVHNQAMDYVRSYNHAGASVRERALATPTPRAQTGATAQADAGPTPARTMGDDLPPEISPDDLKDPKLVADWVARAAQQRLITVLHVYRDEAQVNALTWARLKLDFKRTMGAVLAHHLRHNGRTGEGTIVDEQDGKVLATFTLDGTNVVGAGVPAAARP
ncbi:MAG: hypothetical protein ACR2IE_12945 [Candidatus Sumerlaeaceae bacterium]